LEEERSVQKRCVHRRAVRQGRKFEAADGGTIFLDEIGDLPFAMQGKVLRVLQEKSVTPIGSNEVRAIDVRVIAATNRDLSRMIGQGTFRLDFFTASTS
jgi:transcriptional regulator with PAS, ATPase and Fis domain